jgi:[ribosomal protein S18]-alanine N-acetyltransferase
MDSTDELWSRQCRRIRWAIKADLPDLVTIERQSFAEPWSERELRRMLAKRHIVGQVITSTFGRVAGYMLYGLGNDNLVVERIAVLADDRLLGFGATLIDRLVSRMAGTERHRLIVPVQEHNLGGQLFLKACGLKAGACYVTSTPTRTETWVNFCYARPA